MQVLSRWLLSISISSTYQNYDNFAKRRFILEIHEKRGRHLYRRKLSPDNSIHTPLAIYPPNWLRQQTKVYHNSKTCQLFQDRKFDLEFLPKFRGNLNFACL